MCRHPHVIALALVARKRFAACKSLPRFPPACRKMIHKKLINILQYIQEKGQAIVHRNTDFTDIDAKQTCCHKSGDNDACIVLELLHATITYGHAGPQSSVLLYCFFLNHPFPMLVGHQAVNSSFRFYVLWVYHINCKDLWTKPEHLQTWSTQRKFAQSDQHYRAK